MPTTSQGFSTHPASSERCHNQYNAADKGKVMVAKLRLGLMLPALLLPTQIYSNQIIAVSLSSNSSQNILVAPNPGNVTIKATGGALQP